ncbi:MAG: phosphopantetheine-binding protein [Firmicutes bacterium]|nr:phosphopantetheine-binding protein [Bacillota bacterium]
MEKIIEILEDLHPEIDDFATRTDIIDAAILDSLDIVTLVCELSEAFDIEIPQSEIIKENFNSVIALKEMCDKLA